MCRKMNLDSLSALIPLLQEEDRHFFFFFPPAFIRLLLVRQDVGSEVCLWRLPPGFHFWALLGWGPHWCFKKKFIFTLFCFTLLYWFCHTLTWISHGCTWVPNPEPPSHLPPHTISLGHPSAPAPSILYPASNLDWRFIPYMILYMFPCHSPKSSHPLPLPQSPKVCSIHLCLAVSHTGLSLPSF